MHTNVSIITDPWSVAWIIGSYRFIGDFLFRARYSSINIAKKIVRGEEGFNHGSPIAIVGRFERKGELVRVVNGFLLI